MKPCITICPAIVPTTEDDTPEAMSETRKAPAAAGPSSGVSVLYASWISATSLWPAWKAEAAMITIAMLTRPASARAISTSRSEKRTRRRRSASLRGAPRPWVRPECRNRAWGITVAPMIPTAMVRASASGILGVTSPLAASPQATGAISNSAA